MSWSRGEGIQPQAGGQGGFNKGTGQAGHGEANVPGGNLLCV